MSPTWAITAALVYGALLPPGAKGFEELLKSVDGAVTYPEPNEHCDLRIWRLPCDTRRRRDDRLCPGYRIYLANDGESLIVLFAGGIKRRQQAVLGNAWPHPCLATDQREPGAAHMVSEP